MKRFNNTPNIVFMSILFAGLMLLLPDVNGTDRAAVLVLAFIYLMAVGFFVATHRTVKDRRAR